MQLDIGFGDLIFSFVSWHQFSALLDFPVARIKCYTPESSIAEKFQVMVNLGERNSRMKDFYDIWLFSRQHEFLLENLMGAVERTFQKRLGQPHVPEAFPEVVETVVEFLSPVMTGKAANAPEEIWHPPGPWSRMI